jgi:hypothetical protein
MDDFIYLRRIGLLTPRKVNFVRAGLIALGILLATIGLIPFGTTSTRNMVHDLCAYSVAGVLLAFMLTVRRLLPFLSKEFYALTWSAVVLLVSAVVLHLAGSINTVGVELLAFAIGGFWFVLFIKHVELLVEHITNPAASAAPSGVRYGSTDAPVTAQPIRR